MIKCPCGKEMPNSPEGSYNVGEVVEKSGWFPLFAHVGDIIWLCPPCTEKAKNLAYQLFEVTKSADIYFYGLLIQKGDKNNESN